MEALVRSWRIFPVVVVCALLRLAVPGDAVAQPYPGINLSWGDCGAAGQSLEFFACDTNAGVSTLVVSVVLPEAMPQWNGAATVIDMETSAESVSPWWRFNTGECRAGSLTASFDFFLGPAGCADPWEGAAIGGLNYVVSFNGNPRRMRLRGVVAIPGSVAATTGVEYGVMKFHLDRRKTVGAGACAGCDDKVCMALYYVLVTQPVALGADYTLTNPSYFHQASWRCPGWFYLHDAGCSFSCTVPARSSSWGSIKSLYR